MNKYRLGALLLGICMLVFLLPAFALGAIDLYTTEFQLVTDGTVEDGTYTVVSSSSSDGTLRILHLTDGNTELDRCMVSSADDTLTPTDCTVQPGTGAHTWTITAVTGGYTIRSQTESSSYLNIGTSSASVISSSQTLQIEQTKDGLYTISCKIDDSTYYLSFTTSGWTVSTEPYEVYLYQETTVEAEVADSTGSTGTTTDQPFSSGTAGSAYFRIPSLITLSDGTLVAAIDARWNTTADAGGLDTIVSVSDDNGQTWSYSFPNYFNDSDDAYSAYATAFIDPVMVEGSDGTIYLLVDAFPGGVALNSAASTPDAATGYVEIDNTQRLVLYTSTSNQTDDNYAYYVGDFNDNGLAPVISAETGDTEYYVDEYYYLYDESGNALYCQQIGTTKLVQQNVFYYYADLHVRNASYLWLVTSEDGGETWSAPTILNDQVRTGNDVFYGTGPGAGLCLDDGTIVFPCYTYSSQYASFIYSTDGGATWTRSDTATSDSHWSSESCLVQIDESTIRQFYRDGYSTLYYTDFTLQDDGTWVVGDPVDTGITKTYNNQISAIRYSETIDGKTAILISTATGSGSSRTDGKIYTFLLNDDNSMTLAYTYSVTAGYYAYSSLTELADGSIGLLYENAGGSALYVNIPITDVASGAVLDGQRSLTVPLYGSYTETVSDGFGGYEDIDTDILEISVEETESGMFQVTFIGVGEGTVEFDETYSGYHYAITVSAGDALITETVEAGSTLTIELPEDSTGTITHEADSSIAEVEVVSETTSVTYTSGQGNVGTDSSYNGELVALSDALYTFTATDDDDTYVISAQAADDTTVYLNIKSGNASAPNQTSSTSIEIQDTGSGTFYLVDQATGSGNGGYLYFWRDGKNRFDRNSTAVEACVFYIYRPAAEGETYNTEIPGYVQVTSTEELEDGGVYLIVAQVDSDYYVLYPSTDTSSAYASVVKVNSDAGTVAKTYETTTYSLSVTAISAGTTDVVVDDTIYRIFVTGYLSPVFTWADDYSSAIATFERNDGGEAVKNACTITSETTEPTCTEDGSITYTATVDFEGTTYTDTQTITIPATGHSYANTWESDETGHWQVCTTCGKASSVSEHTFEWVTDQEATETEDGSRHEECSVCGYEGDTETIPATGTPDIDDSDDGSTESGEGDTGADTETDDEIDTGADGNTDAESDETETAESDEAETETLVFTDVPLDEDIWYVEVVYAAAKLGYMTGYADGSGSFGPTDELSRADAVMVLWKMAGRPGYDESAGSTSCELPYSDVSGSAYYALALKWATDLGIVSGDGGALGTFRPADPVTREELAKMLCVYAQVVLGEDVEVDAASALAPYADADEVSGWAVRYVAWLVGQGVMGVESDLNPTDDITRAEVAAMVVRLQPEGQLDGTV